MRDSARELFITQGYASTTMGEIASAAGVAVQTVYYTFRTKGALLCEVMDVTAAGTETAPPVGRRAWMHEAMTDPSPQRALAVAIEHGTGIFERAAPLWPAMNAAAANDPSIGAYWARVTADRRAGQRALVVRLAELGGLRPGLDVERATDLVVVLVGHDTYTGLVRQAGWSVPAYKAWLFATLTQQLLAAPSIDASAVAGLSFCDLVPNWTR